jgi:glycosyltransferase involved in cell wall biosynthesis
MRRKWEKERVVIYTGPAWEKWDRKKVDEGMAGSETWAAYIAREFVKKGYRTTVYNDLLAEDQNDTILDPVHDGDKLVGEVMYRHHIKLSEDVKYDVIDYFISSRTLEPLKLNLHSLRNYVMAHDIWLSSDPNMDIMPWRVQGYGYLSEWHKQFLMQHHKMPADKMFLTANGLTPPDAWDAVDTYTKKNQAVYSSSPDRGLFQLLKMLPVIREQVPDFNLVVAYGFINWESMCRYKTDVEGLKFIDDIKRAMDQPGVEYVGRISKKELAKRQMESKVWLFPTWFSESFCISSIEAGMSKCALLSTDFAGLSTTVGSAGILFPVDGLSRNGEYPESYTTRFVDEAVRLLTDDGYRQLWANKAYEKMKEYQWDKIADGWLKEFKK